MYKTDIIYDNNNIEYRIEYAYKYNIPYSSPVTINIFRHDKDEKGHPISSKHVLHIIIDKDNNFKDYQKFVDIIPVEILDEIRQRTQKIFNWKNNFNNFIKYFDWFIPQENEIAAKAFTIYYLIDSANMYIKPGFDTNKNPVEVTADEDKYTMNVTITFDYILITLEDYEYPIFIKIYEDKIIFNYLWNNITKHKLNFNNKDEIKNIIKELVNNTVQVTKNRIEDFIKMSDMPVFDVLNDYEKRLERMTEKEKKVFHETVPGKLLKALKEEREEISGRKSVEIISEGK